MSRTTFAHLSLSLALGLSLAVCGMIAPTYAASSAKKTDKRSQMTDAQKKELRRKGREWCRKNHAKGNATIERIEIMSDGRIRCWFRG